MSVTCKDLPPMNPMNKEESTEPIPPLVSASTVVQYIASLKHLACSKALSKEHSSAFKKSGNCVCWDALKKQRKLIEDFGKQ